MLKISYPYPIGWLNFSHGGQQWNRPAQPIAAILVNFLADKPTIFHVDAVQAIAKIPTEDYLTERVTLLLSVINFMAYGGVGFVHIKFGKKISPAKLNGGGQESDVLLLQLKIWRVLQQLQKPCACLWKIKSSSRTAKMKEIILEKLAKYPGCDDFFQE